MVEQLTRNWQFEGSNPEARNTKGGSITVPLTSCLTGLDFFDCFANKNKICQLSYT